ncbi:MAG: YceI family protein [Anaerolineae bacterium]|nr:YceI family protein [Anaerolineae bacterium]MDW8173755.1 YceI family protein [Anaerolineae bacterium]
MGNTNNTTPRTVKTIPTLLISAAIFLAGVVVGVIAWTIVSGGSGEASVSAEQRAPQLSLDDVTEEATPVPPTNTAAPTAVPPTNTAAPTAVPPTNTVAPTAVPPTNTAAPETTEEPTTTPTRRPTSTPRPTQPPAPAATEEPTATATRRPTSTPAPTNTPQAQGAQTITRALYRIDSEQSEARFLIDEDLRGQRITVVGRTNQIGGDIIVNFAAPSESQVGTMVINARTLVTDNELRNSAIRGRILRSAEAAYEFIEFMPKRLVGLPASAAPGQTISFQIVGDLKIIEVTREVTFDVTLTVEENLLRGSAKTQVLYKDFNITIPNVPGVANISDEVGLELDFVANLVEAR